MSYEFTYTLTHEMLANTHGDDTVHIYSSRFNSNDASSSGVITYVQNQEPIDSWIEELNLNTSDESVTCGDISEMTMM